VLVVWDAGRLHGLFGIDGTRQIFDELRVFARKLGHEGIHLHHDCTLAIALGSSEAKHALADMAALGFDSYGLYNPIVISGSRRPSDEEFPQYGAVAADAVTGLWPELDRISPLPFLPAVSPGWDTAPRYNELPRRQTRDREEWPGALVVVDETPAAFEAFVRAAFAYLNANSFTPNILTIGCWNEWTEGQYLLPDTRLGYGMLAALSRALGRKLDDRFYASPGGDPLPGESEGGPRLELRGGEP
jgi:hypothetical protein